MMSERDELPYWLALRRAGLGSTSFALLIAKFGSIGEAWQAPAGELRAAGVEEQYVRSMARVRASFDADQELEALERAGARALTWRDEGYPERLRQIAQSPPVLVVRGAAGPEFPQAVAVVGTRGVTPYGRQATESFCGALAELGVAIVSGLARGVDAIAHRVAVERGAPTVAVLAGGIDRVYPREHAGLAERICEVGCLVSEYPLGTPARRDFFPRRNRILSGLARAVLVVEAGEGSGALHTANWAFEQGRDVFAVPGSVFSPQSAGTNQLIRENTAKLVARPEQLCEELNLLGSGAQFPLLRDAAPPKPAGAGRSDDPILALLARGPLHIDELTRALGQSAAEVSGALSLLEIDGLIRQTGPMTYAIA
ncbi:MAG: DNA processing protein DprA [Tepidiforma sp.]|nr:MAG: DNA processing protein DprA [Tepidiforma sp.]